MMLCIVTMLISGPLAVWSGGDVIGFFSLGDIPSPLPPNEAMHNVLTATHATVSKIIFGAFVLHAVGAAKGETSVRMMVATKDAPE
jgi:cytochrome b561